jgi:hypothetical protein
MDKALREESEAGKNPGNACFSVRGPRCYVTATTRTSRRRNTRGRVVVTWLWQSA